MAQGQVQGGALQAREAHKSINPEGCQGINSDHKCKFKILGLGRAACPHHALFNIYSPKRSTRRPHR